MTRSARHLGVGFSAEEPRDQHTAFPRRQFSQRVVDFRKDVLVNGDSRLSNGDRLNGSFLDNLRLYMSSCNGFLDVRLVNFDLNLEIVTFIDLL